MRASSSERPTSIKDIARAAGVAHSTVSRALRGSPSVRPETAVKIRRHAEEMGYKPSAIARSLVTRKTQTIGVIVSSIGDPFNGQVVNGIEEVAHQNGYSLMLANARTDPDRVISVVRSFQERRVEGILVTASRVGALYTPLISEMQVPIVLLNNRQEGKFVHSVTIDNFKAGCQATRHLIELGHTRISYIGDRLGFQSNIERFAGYQQALSEAGITFRPELVAHGDGRPKGGMQAMCNLLATPERPTAVFCYNDMSSLGALHAAKSRQVRVPKDLSVVGFDDMFFAPYLQPPLTTIRQPKCGMGKRAMELLLDLLAGKKPEKVVMIQGKLLVRSSTAPPEGKK